MINFVYIGGNTYLPYESIIMLTDYSEPAAKKIVKAAKEQDLLRDFSRGQSKETVAVTRSGFVFVTNMELYEVLGSANSEEKF